MAVAHRVRPWVTGRHPVHVTMCVREGLENLRRPGVFRVLRRALGEGSEKVGFRVNQFSVQSNHLHLIVEASDRDALGRGMCGLATRMAKALNRWWERSGKVFAERYHALMLRNARQVRSALRYVLNNVLRHGGRLRPGRSDPCSSGEWFDGWRGVRARPHDDPRCPVAPARSALQRFVWRRYGLLGLCETPRGDP